MTEGQLMIMCEMVEESQHIQQKGLSADIYTSAYADHQWHYGEFNNQFCTGLQDTAGCWTAETRPGTTSIPRMVWGREVTGFEHTYSRKATQLQGTEPTEKK